MRKLVSILTSSIFLLTAIYSSGNLSVPIPYENEQEVNYYKEDLGNNLTLNDNGTLTKKYYKEIDNSFAVDSNKDNTHGIIDNIYYPVSGWGSLKEAVTSVNLIDIKYDMNWYDYDDGLFDKGHSGKDVGEHTQLNDLGYIDSNHTIIDNRVKKDTYRETYLHHKNCYNKRTKIEFEYDDGKLNDKGEYKGQINIKETNRNTSWEGRQNYTYLDFHSTLDKKEKLRADLIKTYYTFEVTYDVGYLINIDDFENYKDWTYSNLFPEDKPVYTSLNTYNDVAEELRKVVVSKEINNSDAPEIVELPKSVEINFYDSDNEATAKQISSNSKLKGDDVYVTFSNFDSSEASESYGKSKIIDYEIPFISFMDVETASINNDIPENNSFGNKSSSFLYGGIKNNNIKLFLNTGGIVRLKSDNISSVQYKEKGAASYEYAEIDSGYYRIDFREEGKYLLKIKFDRDLHSKGPDQDNESDSELITEVILEDGETFFKNNDFKTQEGDVVEHNYGITKNNNLFEYYSSPNTFRLDTKDNSNYLFVDDYISKTSTTKGSEKYLGNLEKYENGVWVNCEETDLKKEEGKYAFTIGNENSGNTLYRYTLKDVFGYEYNYYLESYYKEGASSYGIQKYFNTKEGNDLLTYLATNYPEQIRNIEDIQNNYNYKTVGKHRDDLIGKKNIRYYVPNSKKINEFVGKVEYGTKLFDIKDNLINGISSDLYEQGYDNGTFEIKINNSLDTELTDLTEINFNLIGKRGTSTYGESSNRYEPPIVRNLTKLQLDSDSLSNVTRNINQDLSFKKDIQPILESELYLQLREEINEYFNINEFIDYNYDGENDISIYWKLPSYQNDEIIYGNQVSFRIISNNDDYYINKYEGTFISKTFYKMDNMWISDKALQSETYFYEDGSLFNNMEEKLTSDIQEQIKLKLLNPNDFKIDWYVNGDEVNSDTLVFKEDKIEYVITPKSNERFRGVKMGEFQSKQYVEIQDIFIDVNPLQNYLNSKYKGIEFRVVKTELENMINKQIKDQIGNKYSSYINIDWAIGDDEILTSGKDIKFKLESNSLINVHNSNNEYHIQFRNDKEQFNISILDLLILILLFTFILAIILLLFKLVQ